MSSGLGTNDPAVVSAFHAALLHQGLVVLAILFLVCLAWGVLRSVQLTQLVAAAREAGATPVRPRRSGSVEPAARRLLRIGFGIVWIFDGILQGQSSMPLGMVPQAVQPTAAASPGWVQHLVNAGGTIWSYHPITAAAAAVWIQVGIGAWLIAAGRGRWSRLGGLASAGWGLVVWVFGESFGGIFAPGLSWMFGAPGAVLFYCAGGLLVAMPERIWATPRTGRRVLRVLGAFFAGMAVLQAWPGRGFWQGAAAGHRPAGAITAMAQQMAQTPQPRLLSSWVSAFAGFDAAHGFAVNLFVVLALAGVGACLLVARPAVARAGLAAGLVLCLADWILVQDLGFLGGVGTDPNSMLPMSLVLVAGYVALTRLPAPAPAAAAVEAGAAPAAPAAGGRGWRERILADPTGALRGAAALGAIAVVLLGAVPMAAAAASPDADAIVSEAVDGTPAVVDTPAPAFDLVDQAGRHVSLASLRGKAIALTFLDPVCTSDCPVIAQEFRVADEMLGSAARGVVLVAIDANPRYVQPVFLRAFDRQEDLGSIPNWLYLTGSLPQLEQVWSDYGCAVEYEPGGGMIAHGDLAYVIDPSGHTREVLDADPGPASEASRSSFSAVLAGALRSVAS